MLNAKAARLLHNMAIAELRLKKGGVREPHWHPNANEMAYCVDGKALVTLFSPKNLRDSFTLNKGDVMYIPRGYLHYIENIHSDETIIVLAYDHGAPEDLDLSASVSSMSSHVLEATFKSFPKIKRQDAFITKKKSLAIANSNPNAHKFSLEKINPQIDTKGGCAKIANKNNFPLLDKLALFSLRIYKNGIREPHWHPNATELNYIIEGKARLTIFSPRGDKETFELSKGEGSIIPQGYFHHIENISSKELHMTVFFNHSEPDDIGLSGAITTYSDEVIASIFSIEPKFIAQLKKFQEDRMIVMGGG